MVISDEKEYHLPVLKTGDPLWSTGTTWMRLNTNITERMDGSHCISWTIAALSVSGEVGHLPMRHFIM